MHYDIFTMYLYLHVIQRRCCEKTNGLKKNCQIVFSVSQWLFVHFNCLLLLLRRKLIKGVADAPGEAIRNPLYSVFQSYGQSVAPGIIIYTDDTSMYYQLEIQALELLSLLTVHYVSLLPVIYCLNLAVWFFLKKLFWNPHKQSRKMSNSVHIQLISFPKYCGADRMNCGQMVCGRAATSYIGIMQQEEDNSV